MHSMTRARKLLDQIRQGDVNVAFADLCKLVEHLGFTLVRQTGSHRIYRRAGMPLINLQPAKNRQAKPYQVRQVLALVDQYGIEV
jgi:predicted RNA binding protein YcfA (HicA-like mRNA interferase family)